MRRITSSAAGRLKGEVARALAEATWRRQATHTRASPALAKTQQHPTGASCPELAHNFLCSATAHPPTIHRHVLRQVLHKHPTVRIAIADGQPRAARVQQVCDLFIVDLGVAVGGAV